MPAPRPSRRPSALIAGPLAALLVFTGASASAAGTAPVTPTDAMKFFAFVCIDSLPSFKGAEQRALKAGLVREADGFAHPAYKLAIDLGKPGAGRPSCSISFHSQHCAQPFYQAVAGLPGVKVNTSNGFALVYYSDPKVTAAIGGDLIKKDYTLFFLGTK